MASVYDVEVSTFANESEFNWNQLPDDDRFIILASTIRLRYSQHAQRTWKPDLHLVLWNPFQTLDIAAPALITYGSAMPALQAAADWFSGRVRADGVMPVATFYD